MILTSKSGSSKEFEPCPEGMGKAVLVDIYPPEEIETTWQGQTRKKKVTKFVYEMDPTSFGTQSNGEPFLVWSQRFTCSISESSRLRPHIEGILGRKFTESELVEFDSETLIGKCVRLVVVHEPSKDGSRVFAQIASVKAHDGNTPPYVACGKYVRRQDREDDNGSKAAYRKADKPADAGRPDWATTIVHVGKFKGVAVGDLDEEAINALWENWVPKFIQAPFDAGERIPVANTRLHQALAEARKAIAEMKAQATESVEQTPDAAPADADVTDEDCPY